MDNVKFPYCSETVLYKNVINVLTHCQTQVQMRKFNREKYYGPQRFRSILAVRFAAAHTAGALAAWIAELAGRAEGGR